MAGGTKSRKTYGLIGRNISYSLSPVMHNAAFKRFGIEAEYVLFDIEEGRLDEFFKSHVLGGKVSGVNVTVPYKIRIKELLDADVSSSMDEGAQRTGALNTVKVEEGGLIGFNTDGRGFCGSVMDDTGFDPSSKKVFIMGAGGASRAICFYLGGMDAPPRKIFVFDVDGERAASLEKDLRRHFETDILVSVPEKDIPARLAETDLFVNATPLGTRKGDPEPVQTDLFHDGLVVYDLVYCRQTELVKNAKKKGLTAAGGLGMLVNQAALAFDIWTGEEFGLGDIKKVMTEAAEEELKQREKGGK